MLDVNKAKCLMIFFLLALIGYSACGIVFIRFGISKLLSLSIYSSIVHNLPQAGVTAIYQFWSVVTALGFIIVFTGFIGYLAGKSFNKILLIIFSLILLLSIGGGIGFFVFVNGLKSQFEVATANNLTSFIENFYTPDSDMSSEAQKNRTYIDDIQKEYECCGIYGPSDWFNTTWYDNRFLDTESWERNPSSCCAFYLLVSYKECQVKEMYFKKGCYDEIISKVMSTMFDYFLPAIITSGFIIGTAFFCLIASLCLMFWINMVRSRGGDSTHILNSEVF